MGERRREASPRGLSLQEGVQWDCETRTPGQREPPRTVCGRAGGVRIEKIRSGDPLSGELQKEEVTLRR